MGGGRCKQRDNIITGINAETNTGTEVTHRLMFWEGKKEGREYREEKLVLSASERILLWSFRELINDTPAPRLNF